MADFKTHAAAGAAVGIGAYLIGCSILRREVKLGGIVLSGLGGIAGGCLPDAIEPALHPNHRGFFHSVTAGGLLGFGGYEACENGNLTDDGKLAILVLTAAYLSHLILDAATPKSLPIG